MASSIDARTIERSIDFSRATASTICKSSSLLALTAIGVSFVRPERLLGRAAGRGFAFAIRARFRPGLGARAARGGALGFLQRRLFAPQRGADEVVGQDEPRLAHGADRQLDMTLALVVGDEEKTRRRPVGTLRDRLDPAAEALAAIDRDRHLDAGLVPDGAFEI